MFVFIVLLYFFIGEKSVQRYDFFFIPTNFLGVLGMNCAFFLHFLSNFFIFLSNLNKKVFRQVA